jgi:hypothetical protein
MFFKGIEFLNNLFKNLNKEKKMPKSKYKKLKKKAGKTGKGKSYTYPKKKMK